MNHTAMGLKSRKGIGGRPRVRESALSKWIDEHLAVGDDGLSPRQRFAQLLDVTLPYVNDLCRMRRTPGARLGLRIEQATNGKVTLSDLLS